MPPAAWSPQLLRASPLFSDLCQSFAISQLTNWPDIGWFNHSAMHTPMQFVENDELTADGRYYEAYIYATKCVPTRKDNWHDFFGALIWCLFPQTKALLNRLHISEISQHGQKQRSKLRNKLTLFDECGVIICLEPAMCEHATLLRNHQWQQTFVAQRRDWWQGVKPVIFGHAIYEMATAPFLGLTAKCLFVNVPTGFSQWPLTDAYPYLDGQVCALINDDALLNAEQLTPLPLLGVPHWFAANEQPQFYANQDYFRPKRR